jgi:8-oxo-dGTP pyrophosphatase MutT (NUDIX family)
MTTKKTHLDLLNDCDSFPYPSSPLYAQHTSTYYHLRLYDFPDVTLGYLLPSVALTLTNLPDWSVSSQHDEPRTVTLLNGSTSAERSAIIAKTTQAMRETGHFRVLDKWRGELYAVYGPSGEEVFRIERSASPLFGVVTYGVHLTGYTRDKESGTLKLWVPRRAKTKQTYPSMLDNTVAGGMAAGEQPFECMVREAMEEASLPEGISRRAKAVGCVTYFYIRDERAGGETGLLQPECQYVYDLDLAGEDVICKPNDEEVEAFELLGVEQVLTALGNAEFKPNCALVMIDFLIRHGIITKENEKDYAEIVQRCHRRLQFPMG